MNKEHTNYDSSISITRRLRNDRITKWRDMYMPRHEDVPKTVYLDVTKLILNPYAAKRQEPLPPIKTMLEELWPESI